MQVVFVWIVIEGIKKGREETKIYYSQQMAYFI